MCVAEAIDAKALIYTIRSASSAVGRVYPGASVLGITSVNFKGSWLDHSCSINELAGLVKSGASMVGVRIKLQSRRIAVADFFVDELGRDRWEPGDVTHVDVNQGERPASIVAVLGDEALLEYEMPAGTTALWVIDRRRWDAVCRRNVSYRTCPKKWLDAIEESGIPWTGRGQ